MIYLLQHLVQRAAERDPAHDAFRVPGAAMSYGSLEERSNQLAHLLVEDGVQRGDRVGIFMPRCLESPLAVYGILKSGAAFVPVDPHLPLGALRRVLADCGIRHLITHPSLAEIVGRLAAEDGSDLRSVVGVDALPGETVAVHPWAALEEQPAGCAPQRPIVEDDLAYLMYSSGSTGRPKGIMHSHRSGLAYARLSVHTYDVQVEDRIGNHSPLHFDMSTFGYFSSPYAGATTLLVPEAYTKLTASLSQLMAAERLTIWYSVPLALIQLLMRGVLEERDLSSLRWVLYGGEPFARQHLHALMRHWPQARFSNVYGPAEVNQCTYHHLPIPAEESAIDEASPVPIGRTWANTEGLVLNAADEIVGPGEEGELVIRSPTMMSGYWGRPDLNARAFYRQSTQGGPDRVFYRTGDLVRVEPDGDLVFLGRKDRQVKIRGHRVELDEIERTLSSHPKVEEAAVFPVRGAQSAGIGAADNPGDSPGVNALHAVYTARPGCDLLAEELRTFLQDQMSPYAVPSELELRSELSRTTSGKIDRRQLQLVAEQAVAEQR